MEKRQLELVLSVFMNKHLGVKNLTTDVKPELTNASPTNSLISDLQNLICQLKDILAVLSQKGYKDEPSDKINQNGDSSDDLLTLDSTWCEPDADCQPQIDPNLVQVRANKKEVDRRIAAFLDKKRLEVNDGNRREFCCDLSTNESCARVRSVFIKRPDSKGHVKVSKVFNTYGPQTKIMSSSVTQLPTTEIKTETNPQTTQDGMAERVKNIADHLDMKLESRRDLAEKIRCLEERILYLESLSPEYFSKSNHPEIYSNSIGSVHSAIGSSSRFEKLGISEIDEKIHILKQSLKRKASMMIRPAQY